MGESIKSNSVAPVTIRSMPKVTQDMLPPNRMNEANNFGTTVKMKAQPRSVSNGGAPPTAKLKPISVDTLNDKQNGHHPNETHISTGAPIYRWMMRLVLGLLFVAVLLSIILMVIGRL